LSVVAKALGADKVSSKVLVVLHRDEDLAWISLRNVAALHVITVDQLNAYDVLVNDDVVFTSAALSAYIAGPPKGKAGKATATDSEADTAASTASEGEELR
jgi:large subunit ribosomal protein L4